MKAVALPGIGGAEIEFEMRACGLGRLSLHPSSG